MNEVIDGHEEVIVTRGDRAVVMSLEEFNGWMEMIHLLRNPANVEHLLHSIAELNDGRDMERPLLE